LTRWRSTDRGADRRRGEPGRSAITAPSTWCRRYGRVLAWRRDALPLGTGFLLIECDGVRHAAGRR